MFDIYIDNQINIEYDMSIDKEDIRLLIEMCFDLNSPMSGKLKDTLLQMMKNSDKK